MSTRTNLRRDRARRRGLATFVTFLLLIGFALGTSSLTALAASSKKDSAATANGNGPKKDEAASEDAAQPDAGTSEDASAEVESSDEAPAEEPAANDGADDAATSDGAAAASSDDSGSSTKSTAGDDGGAAAAPIGIQQIDGGDVDLDYVAAGAFTYDHSTGLGTNPPFGYNNRTISNTNGVVESLESGDFACDDLVTFFTQVTIDDGAAGSGTVELDYSFGNETTGQPGLGFTDIISAAINTPDGGNVGNVGDNVVTLTNEFIETQGYDELHGTVTVTNLAPGEVAIVRVIVQLECFPGSPTGNILTQIEAARADGDTVSVGQQTVPMKVTGFVAEPAIDITKFCPEEPAVEGETITFEITIENTGNDDLTDIVVTDTVNGHDPEPVSGAPATLLAGDSVQLEFTYTVQVGDPDPLPNTVTVEAVGVLSETTVTDTAGCDTDLEQNPAIQVTKECPPVAHLGDEVTYTITVENTGDVTLVNLVVTDTVDGHDPVQVPGATTLAPGDSAEFVLTHVIDEGDPDPLPNSVTATANPVGSETSVSDTDECVTDLLNPAIDIVKTVSDDTVPAGTTVTYTYVITNTGDTTLFDVTVDDDILGHIGDIPTLEPGQSVTLTKDFVVGEAPVVNVAIAEGEDVLGRSVSADDDALVTPVLAETPPPTPFTGSDASRLAMIALGLFGLGATLVAATRRRRARETA